MTDPVTTLRIEADFADARREFEAFRGSLQKISGQAAQTQTSMQELVNKTTGVRDSMRSAAASAEAWQGAIAQDAAEAQRLRASIDPLYAATMRYEAALSEVTLQQQLGNYTGEEAARLQMLLKERYDQTTASLTRAGAEQAALGRSTGAMGSQVQNAAFQVGDFFAQVSAGTDVTRAAGMQLPQLLGAFGVWGAVAGAAAAALVPLIGNIFSTGEETGKTKGAVEALSAALDDFERSAGIAGESVDKLREKYGRLSEAVKEGARIAANAAISTAQESAKEAANKLGGIIDGIDAAQQRAAKAGANYLEAEWLMKQGMAGGELIQQYRDVYKMLRDEVDNLAASLGMSASQAFQLRDAINAMETSQGFGEIAASAGGVLTTIESIYGVAGKLPPEIADLVKETAALQEKAASAATVWDQMNGTSAKMAETVDWLAGRFEAAMVALRDMADAQPGEGFLATAMSKVAAFTTALWDAAAAARAVQDAPPLTGPAGAPAPPVGLKRSPIPQQRPMDLGVTGPATTTGSGGGMDRDSFAALVSDAQAAMSAMDLALATIREKTAAGMISMAEADKAATAARQQAANKLAEIIPQIERANDVSGPKAEAAIMQWREQLRGLAGDLGTVGAELSKSFSEGFEKSFAAFISGTESASDAFQSFGDTVIQTLSRMMAQRFTDSIITPLFDSILGSIGLQYGGVASSGGVAPFAKGGLPGIGAYSGQVVSQPTLFGMGGDQIGLMGEAGAEAIMPLRDGGVRAVGPSGEGALPLTRDADGYLAVAVPFAQGGLPAMQQALVGFAPAQMSDFERVQLRDAVASLQAGLPPDLIAQMRAALARPAAPAPAAPAAQGPSKIVINVNGREVQDAKVTDRTQGDTRTIDAIFEMFERRLGSNISQGSGLALALQQAFQLNKRVR